MGLNLARDCWACELQFRECLRKASLTKEQVWALLQNTELVYCTYTLQRVRIYIHIHNIYIYIHVHVYICIYYISIHTLQRVRTH